MDYTRQQFERLYKDNYRKMYRLAYSIVEDEEDAKDAVSQVFTELWNKKPQIADESLSGYLLAATRNQCLHTLRKHKLRRELEGELKEAQEVQENMEHAELMDELHRVIEQNLTEQDRRILSLHYDDEMTYAETAETLGISSSAVNKHITRSLFKIRNILKIAQ